MIGNENTLLQLHVASLSAKKENRSLPHTLLTGAAGCGKTTTAKILSGKSGGGIIQVAPEGIKTNADVLNIVRQLDNRGYDEYGNRTGQIFPTIVFVDEIHRMPVTGQEHMGILMEEWKIPVPEKQARINPYDGMGVSRKGRMKNSPWFTLVGATTKAGLLSKPFRDRFKLTFLFHTYDLKQSVEIVKFHAKKKDVLVSDDAAFEIAKRGRGVPRVLVGLLDRCIDTMHAANYHEVTKEIALNAFLLLKIDSTGLTQTDIKILKTLYDSIDPIGLENLSITTNEAQETIKDSIEPYLIQRGFIVRMSRGRKITEAGEQYLLKHGHVKPEQSGEWFDVTPDFKRRM